MDATTYNQISQLESPLHRIGIGFCGSVWKDPIAIVQVAVKREDGGPGRSLKNDSHVCQQLKAHQTARHSLWKFAIPQCHGFVPIDRASEIVRRFPSTYTPCNRLLTERIQPMPAEVRSFLIEDYCPEKLASQFAADTNNNNCLIRPYLGRRRRRLNHNTTTNSIDDENDKNNKSSFTGRTEQSTPVIRSQVLGNHSLWILDFDCCRSITMDKAGMEQAARAFWKKDHFYPRPQHGKDETLCAHFQQSFLQASAEVIGKIQSTRISLGYF
ncbi:zinc finger protein-domain-containing protein [Xylariaceae sp. FL1651]|nr:zinc finger protein-domain-containing protein [Xylariaceae sp. FL1651]